MDIIIYENKQEKISSIRVTNKHITDEKNFYKHYGTMKTQYKITPDKAFTDCKKFFLNKLTSIGQRVDVQQKVQKGSLTWEQFCNDNMTAEVF